MSIQPNYPLFDPAFNASVTGESYENPTNTVYTPPVLGTGNPDPVYDPAFAEYAEGTPYNTAAPQGPPVVPFESPQDNKQKTGNAYQTAGTIYGQPPAQPSAQPTGVYGPAFFSKNLNQAYQAAGHQFNTVVRTSYRQPGPTLWSWLFCCRTEPVLPTKWPDNRQPGWTDLRVPSQPVEPVVPRWRFAAEPNRPRRKRNSFRSNQSVDYKECLAAWHDPERRWFYRWTAWH